MTRKPDPNPAFPPPPADTDGSVWCRSRSGEAFTFESFLEAVRGFHGHPAPGLVIGGRMVSMAMSRLPEGILFDAVCETANCLPDAVQMLTPCTVGNGWLRIRPLGRYALALYDKTNGRGVRVAVDAGRLARWDEVETWFFKRKDKSEQDQERLFDQMRTAGDGLFSVQSVRIRPDLLEKHHLGERGICPLCGESYPRRHGVLCRPCQGDSPYVEGASAPLDGPDLAPVPVEQAVGRTLLHDMTEIVPGRSKGPAFRKGQVLEAGDVCRLHRMGRRSVYLDGDPPAEGEWVHEDDAALGFARRMAGEGVCYTAPPREGKVDFKAAADGLLVVDEALLEAFNTLPGVMCASRQGFTVLCKGRSFAGTRALPLYLSRRDFARAVSVLDRGPVFRVLPMRKASIGVLITGTEVFQGKIQDRFLPVIRSKADALGCRISGSRIVPDDREAIATGVRDLVDAGADLLITTAGLSVDPDDVTRQGLLDAGAENLRYGVPVLPGAMTLLADIGAVPVLGVPACALHFKTTSLDLLLPRLLAGLDIRRSDLARLGLGGYCLGCKVCAYPKCSFGK